MNKMDTTNVKVGEEYFGIVYNYSFRFLKGIKIKKFTIVKVNPKSFKISFDAETRRWPQLMRMEDTDCIGKDVVSLATNYMRFIQEESKFPNHLKETIIRYCKRKIRESTRNSD